MPGTNHPARPTLTRSAGQVEATSNRRRLTRSVRHGDNIVDMNVLIVVVLIATAIPCLIAYCLIRFVPRARYLPSVLLGTAGFYFFISGANTKPTGGGISGFGDLHIFAAVMIGGIFILAAGVAFLLSFLMYRRWRSRHGG